MIEFRCLGSLELRDLTDDRELHSVLAQPKRVGLLAYLTLCRPRGFHSRERLFGVFWPEADHARARKALDQAVYTLRRGLGAHVLERRDDGGVRIDPERLACDAVGFEEALDDGRTADALELYRGHLLESFYVDDCPDFERWLEAERRRLGQRAHRAASDLASENRLAGNLAGALRWLERATEWNPYDEDLLRDELELRAALGDRSGALTTFARFQRRLASDLELEPSHETTQLIERIRARPAPVQPVAGGGSTSGLESSPLKHAERQPVSVLPDPSNPPGSRWLVGLIGSGVVVLALLAGFIWQNGPSEGAAGEAVSPSAPLAHRVLVSPLRNETGDPTLDVLGRMAADRISRESAATGVLEVIPWTSAVHDAPGSIVEEEDPFGSDDFWLGLAAATHSRYLVGGTYHRGRADTISFEVLIQDAHTGVVVRSIARTTGRANEPAAALDEVGQRAAAALAAASNPSLASWERLTNAPPNLEAYRLYSAGLDTYLGWMHSGNPAREMRKAADYFHRAVALDSSFAAPLIWAFYAHRHGAEWAQRDSVAGALERRRAHLTTFENAVVDALVAESRGDFQGKYDAYRRVVGLVSTSEWQSLLGEAAFDLRRYREAADILSNLDPSLGWLARWEGHWYTLTWARHLAGDHETELRDAKRYLERFPESGVAIQANARALAALGRDDEAIELALRFADAADPLLHSATVSSSWVELRGHGRRAAADDLLHRWLGWYESLPPDQRSRAGAWSLLLGVGRLDDLQTRAGEQLRVASGQRRSAALAMLGVLAARRGEPERAREMMDELDEGGDPAWRGYRQYLRRVSAPRRLP
jgi:serine/threonine-protein kinase